MADATDAPTPESTPQTGAVPASPPAPTASLPAPSPLTSVTSPAPSTGALPTSRVPSSGIPAAAAPEPMTPPKVLADVVSRAWLGNVALILLGAGVIAGCAQVSQPTTGSLPSTLEVFAVLLVAAMLGPWRSLCTGVIYVGAGLLGVPWFPGATSGMPDATRGYLVGILVTFVVVGAMWRGGRIRGAIGMLIGLVLIYAAGAAWLMYAVPMTFTRAVNVGVTPFIVPALLQAAAASGVVLFFWLLVDHRRARRAAA